MRKINQNSKIVMMIGPDWRARGGISAVIRGYIESGTMNKLGVEYYATYKGGLKTEKIVFYIFSFINILSHFPKYKILHVHTASKWSFRRLAPILLLGKLFHKKIIIHIHGGGFDSYYINSSLLERYIIRETFALADQVIVLSEIFLEKIRFFSNPKNTLVIHNSVIKKVTNNIVSRKNQKVPYNLIFLGTIIRRKGIFDLLEATKLIVKKKYNVRLFICGEGHIETVKKYIASLGLEDNVLITGWVSGKRKESILEEGYILILPSYVEAFPMSLIEGMSMGLPVIATSVGGIREIVEDLIEGFIIPPGNIEILSRRIELLLKDRELWNLMSKAAIRKVDSKFTYEKSFLKLRYLYQSLIDL